MGKKGKNGLVVRGMGRSEKQEKKSGWKIQFWGMDTNLELREVIIVIKNVNGDGCEWRETRLSTVDSGHCEMMDIGQFSVKRLTCQITGRSVDEEVARCGAWCLQHPHKKRIQRKTRGAVMSFTSLSSIYRSLFVQKAQKQSMAITGYSGQGSETTTALNTQKRQKNTIASDQRKSEQLGDDIKTVSKLSVLNTETILLTRLSTANAEFG